MSDLISRSAVIGVLEECNYDREFFDKELFGKIEAMVPIEAVPVVHGFNDNRNYHEVDEFRCSVCGLHLEDWERHVHDEGAEFIREYEFKYCPECGAKMKGGAE